MAFTNSALQKPQSCIVKRNPLSTNMSMKLRFSEILISEETFGLRGRDGN